MKIIGITGGIGSGKSIVSKLLEINGIPVYNSDRAAKEIYDTSPLVREKLCARFGPALYRADQTLDRPMLASLIFNRPADRDFVTDLIHPAVEADFAEWCNRRSEYPFLGVESAILFESGLQKVIAYGLNVSAPPEIRIRRAEKRDRIDRKTILRRMRNQMTDDERAARADYTLINNDRQPIIPQVEEWLATLSS